MVAVLLCLASFASAAQQDDSLGMTSTEVISYYNATISALLGAEGETSTIKEAKYLISNEFDLMSTKVESCDILFHIYKNGNIGFIHISVSKDNPNRVEAISGAALLFMVAVTKGQGLEDMKVFVGNIKNAINSKEEATEIKFRGIRYKIITAGEAIQCVILR